MPASLVPCVIVLPSSLLCIPAGGSENRTALCLSAHRFGLSRKSPSLLTYSASTGVSLPIIAFKHKSVGREGIRDLLHLNPIDFTEDSEVLTELPKRLGLWKSLKPSGVELQLSSKANLQQDGHTIRTLETTLVNETNNRIENYELEIRLPSGILKHWNTRYPSEVQCNVPGLRVFRFDQSGWGAVRPRDRLRLATFEYCTACAVAEHQGIGALVAEARLGARVWVNGVEYRVEKSIKELAAERDRISAE